MHALTALTTSGNRLLYRLLPDWLYLKVVVLLFGLFDIRRRHSRTRVESVGSGYRATTSYRTYHFYSAFRVGRYLYNDPKDGIEASLIKKYTQGDVRVQDADVVVDIGANVGEFSLAVSDKASKLLAVEPDEAAFRCLELNLANRKNVRLIQAVIGDLDGEKSLFVSSDFSDSSLIEPTEKWSRQVKVESLTLSALISLYSLEKIDFLKLEAEGFEPEILQSAGDALKHVRKIAIDASPERHGKPTGDACADLLEQQGFDVSRRGWMVFGVNSDIAPAQKSNAC